MAMNQPFTTASQSIASYSYTDIADGTGIQQFYGICFKDSAASFNVFLSQNLIEGVVAAVIGDNATFDFDLSPFTTPRDVTGTAYIEMMCDYGGSDTSTFTVYVKHYDGSTATTLGSRTTAGINGEDEQVALSIDLTSKHFKKGDILRVSVRHVSAGSENGYVHTTKTNPFKVFIPFKLNL